MDSTVKKDLIRILTAIPGFFLCLYFLLRHPRTHYAIVSYGLGDAILSCQYLPAFKRARGLAHVTLVGKKRMADLYDAFPDSYDARILLGDRMLVMLSNAMRFDAGFYLFDQWAGRITLCHDSGFMRHYLLNRAPNVKMPDLFRSGVFGLFPDAPRAAPQLPATDVSALVDRHSLVRGRTVLLSPYSNSIKGVPESFFAALTVALTEKGFRCVTSLDRADQTPVPGTEGVLCGLAEAAALAAFCGRVVGVRSGFLDFVSLVPCRVLAIYPQGYPLCGHYSMPEWEQPAQTHEIQYDGDDSLTIARAAAWITQQGSD